MTTINSNYSSEPKRCFFWNAQVRKPHRFECDYHILQTNEPHPCDKYGCPREAKYQLGNSYYCHDKAVSHFRENARTCREEGFELFEDIQQLEI
jgi:hypothetical protein